IWRGEKLVWADALKLDGRIEAQLDHPVAFGGAVAVATALYVAADAAAHLEFARTLLEGSAATAAVTLVNGVLLARFVGPVAAAGREGVMRYVAGIRTIGGHPARLPRVWYH